MKGDKMRQIRRGIFESNSSSVHTLTICLKEDYNKWIKGEVYLNTFCGFSNSPYKDKKFVTRDEALHIILKSNWVPDDFPDNEDWNKEEIQSYIDEILEDDFIKFDDYGNDFDWFEEEYKTPLNEDVIAFGYYGHD